MSSTNEPTVYEKVSTAVFGPPETEAHQAGREAGEAVTEPIDEASKARHDALTPAPKTAVEVMKESIDTTAKQVTDAANGAIAQISEAINPTPKPKTAGEKIGEAIDGATEAMTAEK